MAKKVYRIEHTREVIDLYFVEAESAEQAEEIFMDNYDDIEIEDSWDSEEFGEVYVVEDKK